MSAAALPGMASLPATRPTTLALCRETLSTLVKTSMPMDTDGEKAGTPFAVQPGANGWPQPRATSLPVVRPMGRGQLKSG